MPSAGHLKPEHRVIVLRTRQAVVEREATHFGI